LTDQFARERRCTEGEEKMSKIDAVRNNKGPYDLFMLGLSIFALLVLAATAFITIDNKSRIVLKWADNFVCVLFFIDFIICFYRAPKRLHYLFTWGWIDFLSCIPSVDILRVGRVGRILLVFRLLRALKAARILSEFILNRRGESAFLAAVLLSVLLVTFSSSAILQMETHPESNIKEASDAVWWAFVTLTTVGYGDHYPVTTEGRIIGVMLMITGVGLFGTLSGFVASWFLSPTQKQEEGEMKLLRSEIAEMRELIMKAADSSPSQGKLDKPGD
jgi:voltage-gated potassium channel